MNRSEISLNAPRASQEMRRDTFAVLALGLRSGGAAWHNGAPLPRVAKAAGGGIAVIAQTSGGIHLTRATTSDWRGG